MRCQIVDLSPGHEVSLSRNLSTGTERLSWNDGILQTVEERVFLAKRLIDGAAVYFISIINVRRTDEGRYTCRVWSLMSDNPGDIGSESVDVKIQYFPPKPECETDHQQGLSVQAGATFKVTCLADKGNPTVDLKWERTGDGDLTRTAEMTQEESRDGQRVVSTLTVELGSKDNQIVLVCKMTSEAFPDKIATCHVGPIAVVSDPTQMVTDDGGILLPSDREVRPQEVTTTALTVPSHVTTEFTRKTRYTPNKNECLQTCSTSTLTNWVIATIIAGLIALVLLVGTIVLLFKLNGLHSTPHYVEPQQPQQIDMNIHDQSRAREIYYEVDGKQGKEAMVYMALDKCQRAGDVSVYS